MRATPNYLPASTSGWQKMLLFKSATLVLNLHAPTLDSLVLKMYSAPQEPTIASRRIAILVADGFAATKV
jgi:hypothetical protein